TPVAGAQHAYPETPWFWENSQAVVLAPGIHCFVEGLEYSHGGLTLQETLLPVIQIKARAATSTIRASLTSAKWKGLRLSAKLLNAKGLAADLRTKAADSKSSVLADEYRNRPVQADGHLS